MEHHAWGGRRSYEPLQKNCKGNLDSDLQHSDLYQVDAICTTSNISGGNKIH